MVGTRKAPGWMSLITDEDGQGLTEYALILLFVSITLMAALTFLSGSVDGLLSQIGSVI